MPRACVPRLVLADEIVAAAAEGRFRAYAVERIGQVMELLTGLPEGAPDGAGGFTAGSFDARVAARLAGLAARAKEFAGREGRERDEGVAR